MYRTCCERYMSQSVLCYPVISVSFYYFFSILSEYLKYLSWWSKKCKPEKNCLKKEGIMNKEIIMFNRLKAKCDTNTNYDVKYKNKRSTNSHCRSYCHCQRYCHCQFLENLQNHLPLLLHCNFRGHSLLLSLSFVLSISSIFSLPSSEIIYFFFVVVVKLIKWFLFFSLIPFSCGRESLSCWHPSVECS